MKFTWLLAVLLAAVFMEAGTCTIRIQDATGAAFPRVLVIVKSLDGKGEIVRHLTGEDGKTPGVTFDEGLYRIIATCPYGECTTAVYEVLGRNIGRELSLTVGVRPTDEKGEMLGVPQIIVEVQDSTGKPAVGARVLVRDPEAIREEWHTVDRTGQVTARLIHDPSVVVIVQGGKLFVRRLGTNCVGSSDYVLEKMKCVETGGREKGVIQLK